MSPSGSKGPECVAGCAVCLSQSGNLLFTVLTAQELWQLTFDLLEFILLCHCIATRGRYWTAAGAGLPQLAGMESAQSLGLVAPFFVAFEGFLPKEGLRERAFGSHIFTR